jgi:tetratricopeptide (TPR) repeat protein
LAVALVFGQTVGHEFVNLDDGEYVSENPHLSQGLGAQGIAWTFTHSYAANWIPLTWISLMLDHQFYGLLAGGYHLTNVLLHAATAALLFLVLRRMTGRLWPSAFVAALFAVHPLRAESVAWVTERKDVLSGLFFMLTLAAYVSYVRHRPSLLRYLAMMVFFALGLMAKAMLVTLPFVLLLLDYWPLRRMAATAGKGEAIPGAGRAGRFFVVARLVVEKLPLVALAGACCLTTLWIQGNTLVPGEQLPLGWRMGNILVSYVTYLWQFFCPADLAAVYPRAGLDLPVANIFGAGLLLLGITAAVLRWRHRHPYLLAGWLWYLGMLVPVIGFVQVGLTSRADRFTYLPQIGLAIALAWGAADLCRSWSYRRWWCGIASALVLAILMGCGWRQTSFWRDSESLWTHALDCSSQNSVAHYNFAIVLTGRGQVEEAIAHYRKALALKPDYAEAHNNLALTLAERGEVDLALAHYGKALESKPDYAPAHYNLAVVLTSRRQLDLAIAHYRKAVDIRPDYAQAHNNLALLLAARGEMDLAIAHYQKALEVKPDYAEAHNNFGNVLAAQGQLDLAITHYQKALDVKPDYAEAHYNLGNALAGQGQTDLAIARYQKALDIQPNYAQAHNNLAVTLAGRGEVDLALAHYRKALAIKPDYAVAHFNLANTLAGRGRADLAVAHYREAVNIQRDYTEAHANLANALLALGRREEAIEHLRRVVELSPAAAMPRNDLGIVLAVQGRFDETLTQFRQALQIQPDCVEARTNLAWLRATCPKAALRNGREAIEHARRADQLCGGQRADVLGTLAAAYAEAGRFPEALAAARKALDLATRQKSPASADVLRKQIALYEAGKPFHEALPK